MSASLKSRVIKISILLAECAMICIVIFAIIAGALYWKLQQGPLDASFLKPRIQAALNRHANQVSISFEDISLTWQKWNQPLLLNAEEVVVSDQDGPFLLADTVDINFSVRFLLLGQLVIEEVILEEIDLAIIRLEDGSIGLTSALKAEDKDQLPSTAILSPETLLEEMPRIRSLKLRDGAVVYSDLIQGSIQNFKHLNIEAGQKFSRGKVESLGGYIGLGGSSDPNENQAMVDFLIDRESATANFSGRFQNISFYDVIMLIDPEWEGPKVSGRVNARISTTTDLQGNLTEANAQLQSSEGHILWPEFFEDPEKQLDYEDVKLSVGFDKDLGKLYLDEGTTFTIEDIQASLSADLNIDGYDLKTLTGPLQIDIPRLGIETVQAFWPDKYQGSLASKWVTKRLQDGIFTDINVRAVFGEEDKGSAIPGLEDFKVGFAFENLLIDYNSPMIPAENAKGRGEYHNKALSIDVESGNVGAITVDKGTLYFDDLVTTGEGEADIKLSMRGALPAVFDYLARDPINIEEDIDIPMDNAAGDAVMDVVVTFPTVKDLRTEDVRVEVNGTLSDAKIPGVLRGMTLTGGPFDVYATDRKFDLKGSGYLDGQAITLDWSEYFSYREGQEYLSRVTAKLTTTDAIRAKFSDDFAGYLSGLIPVDLTYNQPNRITADIDITGSLDEAVVRFDPAYFYKDKGRNGNFSVSGKLTNGVLTQISKLSIKGDNMLVPHAQFKINAEGHIIRGQITNAELDKNRLSVDIEDKNGVLHLGLTGKYLNAIPYLSGASVREDATEEVAEDITDAQQLVIALTVDEVETAEGRTIHDVKGYLEGTDEGFMHQIEVDATVDQGSLRIRYNPATKGPYSLRIEADDAGSTLRALGLYEHMRGGYLTILGKPIKGGRFEDVGGSAQIENFAVTEAPVLAKLLNALSLPGIMTLLSNDNLTFTRLESDFEWYNREDGGRYIIRDGRTSGTSLGLTFEGLVDKRSNEVQLNGTAIPMSEVSNFIGKIPLVGDILTGGDNGGIFAATYTIKGPTTDPDVFVNPLSVLAPGILRRILFENSEIPDEIDSSDTPPQEYERDSKSGFVR